LFERPHHRRVAHALQALDGPRLREWGCLFGGGTAIALRFGEYRESVDIDFLVSDLGVYRELRQVLTGIEGLAALQRANAAQLVQAGELRADQYGIRGAGTGRRAADQVRDRVRGTHCAAGVRQSR
jgi:hypothetical protein